MKLMSFYGCSDAFSSTLFRNDRLLADFNMTDYRKAFFYIVKIMIPFNPEEMI